MMDIVMPGKKDAHELMIFLCKLLDDYQAFTVGDLAEALDQPLPGYPSNLGWTEVSDVEIFFSRTQSFIRFPDPKDVSDALARGR